MSSSAQYSTSQPRRPEIELFPFFFFLFFFCSTSHEYMLWWEYRQFPICATITKHSFPNLWNYTSDTFNSSLSLLVIIVPSIITIYEGGGNCVYHLTLWTHAAGVLIHFYTLAGDRTVFTLIRSFFCSYQFRIHTSLCTLDL